MPPFSQAPVITGFKDKVDCLHLAGEPPNVAFMSSRLDRRILTICHLDLFLIGDQLYVAYGAGSIHTYNLSLDKDGVCARPAYLSCRVLTTPHPPPGNAKAKSRLNKKGFTKKPIEQIGVLPVNNQLVTLSGALRRVQERKHRAYL